MTKSKHINSPRHVWTDAEVLLLRQLYPDAPASEVAAALNASLSAVYQKAYALGLQKSEAFYASDKSARIKRAGQTATMIASRFKKGMKPWNTGMKGWCPPGIERTQFKKGHMPQTWVPVGSYRITTRDHILQRKVSNVPGPSNLRWVPVTRLVWEAAHGPVPSGSLVIFKHPSLRTTVLADITLDKLECITRTEHVRRNHPRSKSPELGRLVQLRGAITRQINKLSKTTTQATQGATP